MKLCRLTLLLTFFLTTLYATDVHQIDRMVRMTIRQTQFTESSDVTFMVTLPRTCTNLTREVIMRLTQNPTHFSFNPQKDWLRGTGHIWNLGDSEIDLDKKMPILVTHLSYIKDLNQLLSIKNGNNLVVTLRDPKELYARSYPPKKDHEKLDVNAFMHSMLYGQGMICLLRLYDSWPEDRRLMVNYEDLIENPELVITKIKTFFQIDEEIAEQLVQDFDVFKKKVHHGYKTKIRPTINPGDTAYYHSNKFTKEQLLQIDEAMYKKDPEMFEKYLSRYKLN